MDAGERSDGGANADGGATATCLDGQRNGLESDVDCGGPCGPCALGRRCDVATDCGSQVCVSAICAAPDSVCRAGFAGCTTFVDLTTDPAPTIRFPVGGDRYVPDCVRLKLGQTITFSGAFAPHPLEQACGPVDVLNERTGNTRSFTLTEGVGVYGFWCTQHGSSSGQGMAGAIEVVR